jgi:hypothetical protein
MSERQDDTPTVRCPVTFETLFVGFGTLRLSNEAEIICPSCGRRHVWDATTLVLVDNAAEKSQ